MAEQIAMLRKRWMLIAMMTAVAVRSLSAQEVRIVEKDGTLFRETRTVDLKPITQMRLEEQPVTRYTERFVTEFQTVTRQVAVPVTEYRLENRTEGRWNIFSSTPPRTTTVQVPYTRWQTKVETVTIPVTRRQLVPETMVTKAPVRVLGFTKEENVSRVALGPANMNSSNVAQWGSGNNVNPGWQNNSAPNQPLVTPLPNSNPFGTPAAPFYNPPTSVADRTGQFGGIRRMDSEILRTPLPASNLGTAWR